MITLRPWKNSASERTGGRRSKVNLPDGLFAQRSIVAMSGTANFRLVRMFLGLDSLSANEKASFLAGIVWRCRTAFLVHATNNGNARDSFFEGTSPFPVCEPNRMRVADFVQLQGCRQFNGVRTFYLVNILRPVAEHPVGDIGSDVSFARSVPSIRVCGLGAHLRRDGQRLATAEQTELGAENIQMPETGIG